MYVYFACMLILLHVVGVVELCLTSLVCVFFFKQKTAYEIRLSLVGSEMCIRDSFCFRKL